ncbi:MAG: hypothetical protein VST66_05295 [Nitrospirota bacterium]|nr:hypothetical protein [Nitrospirota bacterium]
MRQPIRSERRGILLALRAYGQPESLLQLALGGEVPNQIFHK